MIDTHCHLTFPEFAGRTGEVLREAAAAGVTGAISISTTTQDCLEALAVAKSHPRVWCTAGVHPLYSDEGPHQWANLALVQRDPRCVGWGELGLDNHYPEPAHESQRRVLDEQLAFIEAFDREHAGDSPSPAPAPPGGRPLSGRPIVIHCREAFADLIPLLKRTSIDPSRYVFHCFTGEPRDMRLLLDLGAMVSFTGVITYKNAGEVREAARLVPRERFMVETDAPYLSPEPERTKRPCTPAMTRHTLAKLAEVRGESLEALHEQVNENTWRFFGVR